MDERKEQQQLSKHKDDFKKTREEYDFQFMLSQKQVKLDKNKRKLILKSQFRSFQAADEEERLKNLDRTLKQ